MILARDQYQREGRPTRPREANRESRVICLCPRALVAVLRPALRAPKQLPCKRFCVDEHLAAGCRSALLGELLASWQGNCGDTSATKTTMQPLIMAFWFQGAQSQLVVCCRLTKEFAPAEAFVELIIKVPLRLERPVASLTDATGSCVASEIDGQIKPVALRGGHAKGVGGHWGHMNNKAKVTII